MSSTGSARHRRLTELFVQTADLPARTRRQRLEEVEEDEGLVRECLALCAVDDETPTGFLTPASGTIDSTAESGAVGAAGPPFTVGDRVGGFTILELLGCGGMGCVYRAEDPALRREVALKTLMRVRLSRRDRERFLDEGRSLAALDHRNVVTVHAVGEAKTRDGETMPYLVMELIRGQQLDQLAGRSGLDLATFQAVARDVLSGVAAAHRRGIVHRDLKPSNVMITDQGRAKVLDFGLARPAGSGPGESVHGGGGLVGTVPYMSPEQVDGEPATQRSDVFSLGSTLYRAAAGHSPFVGADHLETLRNIVDAPVKPLRSLRPEFPVPVASVIERALAKEPEARFADAGEMAAALDAAARDTAALDTAARDTAVWDAADRPRAPSRQRRWPWLLAATVLIAAVALAWLAVPDDPMPPDPLIARAGLEMLSLTSGGNVIAAAISPDGGRFSYVESVDGLQSLHVRDVDGGPDLELLPPRPLRFWGHTFSHDGDHILFGLKGEEEVPGGAFYRMPAAGGTPVRLVEDIDSAPAISPDGRRLAWYRLDDRGDDTLLIAELAGAGGERRLASPERPYRYGPTFFGGVAFSPNGERIAAAEVHGGGGAGRIVILDATTGESRWSVSDPRWVDMGQIAWAPDQQALLVVAGRSQEMNIWRVPLWTGAPIRLTVDLNSYRIVSLSRDGRRLVTVPSRPESGLWTGSWSDRSRARSVSQGDLVGYGGFDYGPRGGLVYTEGSSLYLLETPEARPVHLLEEDWVVISPRLTARRSVIYGTLHTDTESVRVRELSIDSRTPRDLVHLPFAEMAKHLALTDSGVYWVSDVDQGLRWTRFEGGSTDRLGPVGVSLPSPSPDGRHLAYYEAEVDGVGDRARLVVVALDESGAIDHAQPRVTIGDLAPPFPWSLLRWTPDGDALLLNTMPGDRSNLWSLRLDGSAPTRLTDFDDRVLLGVDVAPDARRWAVARGGSRRDAVLLEGVLGGPTAD